MKGDIVEQLRDFQKWIFIVPEAGHHENAGATRAPIFVPECKTVRGWIPVMVEVAYGDGYRKYMFNPEFMLKQAADEIERLRKHVRLLEVYNG